jgi:hypothetical protein
MNPSKLKLGQLKRIVENFGHDEIEGVIVDVQTANIILKVYEALSETNKEKFINSPIEKMSSIAWSLVN